jgi:acetyl/propionyl-CoA carboxylase alpha subunit
VVGNSDKYEPFVQMADEAVCIGAPSPAESYLNIHVIINAALSTGADTIHPGYGFLSENAVFAESCAKHGITFIGPTPESIRAIGDKVSPHKYLS